MKQLMLATLVILNGYTAMANDFVGIWKPASATDAATMILAYDSDGTIDASSGDHPAYCDQFEVSGNKNILKDKSKNVDQLLVCLADADSDLGVFAITYGENKKEASIKELTDGNSTGMRFVSQDDEANLGQLGRLVGQDEFTLTSEGEGDLTCTKLGSKTVNNAIIVSEMIYTCDATPDPDSNIILLLDNTDNPDRVVARYYFTQDSKNRGSQLFKKMN